MKRSLPAVVIVRDRASSGGGIYNYYNAITPHMAAAVTLSDAGRPYTFYGDHRSLGSWLLNFTPTRLLMDWFGLAFKIIRHRPAVVVVNPCIDPPTWRSLKRDAANLLIGRLLGRRILCFWRGWDNDCCGKPEFPGGNKSLLCRIYKMAHAHIVLSERFKQDLLRWDFKTPVHVETTVVEDQCLAGSPVPPPPTRVRTNLLYLSRVEVGKGVFELLDAFRILKNRNPAYTLTIGGDGPDLEALRAYAKELNLQDVVFTGFLKGQAKVDCYRQGSVFCFLSYTEGMPNAVLEALAMGLPVVSSEAGGLKDILRHGENGFIVLPDTNAPPKKKFNPQAVADAIERLVETPELHERISIINWRYARHRFAAPVVAKRLEALCRSLLPSEPARSGQSSKSVKPVCVE
jgi:glycosyltransferase involved in cell wall biosynthesis